MAPPDPQVRAAVKAALARFQELAPGRAVEIRIPPYAAVQAVPGHVHRRGTPAAIVETDAQTWLGLCDGTVRWADAVADGRVRASGERSDLGGWLPLPSASE